MELHETQQIIIRPADWRVWRLAVRFGGFGVSGFDFVLHSSL